MSLKSLLILAVVAAPLGAHAQTAPTPDFSPPPLVPSSPPPMPPLQPSTPPTTPGSPGTPGTPPPPGGGYAPGQPQTGYPYSPYGSPPVKAPEGPEVGLMVSESLFGMLTAAGVTVLPYFLIFSSGALGGDPTISSVLFLLIFASVPMAVSSTEVGLANGSRYFYSESWPATLVGLAAQAAVLGLYWMTGWLPNGVQVSGGAPRSGGSVELLLIGSAVGVPIIEMIAINIFKAPKTGLMNVPLARRDVVRVGVPTLSPMLVQTATGPSLGVNLGLLNLRF